MFIPDPIRTSLAEQSVDSRRGAAATSARPRRQRSFRAMPVTIRARRARAARVTC